MIGERMKQVELCQNIKPFMGKLIDNLWQYCERENECHVFVTLLKNLLDHRSRTELPKFQTQYLSDWRSLKIAKEQKHDETVIEKLLNRVAQSEKKLYEASFGFEHLCRELGQIFEALSECKTVRSNLQEYVEILPKIAASLLLMGHPFELMDGDVANVPMIWIKAVFRELKHILGDKTLLALSVLGIQGSGKSTLLNTMFGFQFAVSAGRCTRGVYAQLLPVERIAFPFEYILVINTEGLRALELADLKKSHDNELATFVVGLGDITIVNIKGENTTEVQDVLQIVVHAFLRLKLANKKSNLKQRCIFAHQNVPAQDANVKLRYDRHKFIEILDKMTEEAAVQEGIADIQTFNQVIQLDIETDIFYFSDLWRGDPPMAPANPGYSQIVADLLTAMTVRLIVDRKTYSTITDTVTRIKDLWSGILTDNFVFGFRNCLEIKAYNDMERHYHSLTFRLERKVHGFMKYDVKSNLMTWEHPDDFDNQIPIISYHLLSHVHTYLRKVNTEMDSFIGNNGLKDMRILKSEQTKFQSFGKDLITQAKQYISDIKEELKVKNKILTDKTKHELEINQVAAQLAVKLKGSYQSKDVIHQAFNEMWNDWISQLDTKTMEHGKSIEEHIELALHNRFPTDVTYLTEVYQSQILCDIPYHTMKCLENSFPLSHINKEHFSIRFSYILLRNKKSMVECKHQMIQVVNVVFRKIDCRLSELQVQDTKFYNAFVSEILSMICDAFSDHNEHKNNEYHFNLTNAFRACVCLHVKEYLVIFLAELDERYNKKHSPKAVMEEFKGTAWKLFTNTVERKLKTHLL